MINSNEILEMLRDGKTVEDIGNHFAAMLNSAKATYDQEEKEKRQRSEKKRRQLADIIASLADWYDTYVQELNEDVDAAKLAEEIIKVLDIAEDTTTNLNNTVNKLYNYMNFDNQKKKEVKAANLGDDIDLQHLVDMFLGQ
jgi:hypothetical protein